MSRILLFTAGNIRAGAVTASIRSRQTSSASTALRNNITTISSVKSTYSTRDAEPLQGVKRNAKPNADAALGVGIGLAAVAGGILATNKEQDQTFNTSNNNGIKNSHAFYGNSSDSIFPSNFPGALSFMPSYIKRNKLVSCEPSPTVDPTADPDAAAAAAGAPTKEHVVVKTDGNVIPSTEDEVDLPYEHTKAGMTGGGDERGSFHGLFPLRQLWKPCKPYPLWDTDWDGKELPTNDMSDEELLKRDREIRRRGVTRHIILIRHGQYDETHREDHKRILTKLGRQQAHLTGERIAKLIEGATSTTSENVDQDEADSNKNKALFTPCKVIAMHVSDLARAKETAQIIASHLPESLIKTAPDPLLNEGRPCHNIPGGQARPSVVAKVDECHPRIESAFERYFYRAPPPSPYDSTVGIQQHDEEQEGNPQDASGILASSPPAGSQSDDLEQPCLHEFEIIVGHANVIRYFLCRALQLPPEAWLRLCIFNCSLTYLTIRPTGTVSCRMLGDIGHLPYDHSTFSMHHGFNW